nr:LacI family DNA-binding transcriptional regulator [Sphaerisporangium album]
MHAVDELGYVPNSAARSLVTRRTDTIALVVPGTQATGEDPLFSSVVRAAAHALEEAGKQVTLMLAGSPAGRRRVEQYVSAGHVDGVVLVSNRAADHLPGVLSRTDTPVVSLGRPAGSAALPYAAGSAALPYAKPAGGALSYVDADNAGGAAAAVDHLLARGRRRIAMICGPVDSVAAQDRLQGYRDALRRDDRRSILAVGDYSRVSGMEAMRQLLEDDPALDAVFAAGDLMAMGALTVLHESGRRVPDDVAVVGFGDIEAARYAMPPLTTVHAPASDQAVAAVRLLLRQIDAGPASSVILPTELVVRRSS